MGSGFHATAHSVPTIAIINNFLCCFLVGSVCALCHFDTQQCTPLHCLTVERIELNLNLNHILPRYGAPNKCLQYESELSIVPSAQAQHLDRSAERGDSQLEMLLSQIVEASEKGCLNAVKDLTQQVSQCCAVLKAKAVRQKGQPAVPEGGSVVGGLQFRPEFMLWSVLLSDKLNLDLD